MFKRLIFSIKIFMHYLMRGLNNADKLSFGTKDNVASGGIDNVELLESNNVWSSLLKGEITEEVKELRRKTYMVSDESKKYEYIGNGLVTKKSPLHEINIQVDETDGLPIKIIQDNYLIPESVLETLSQVNSYGNDNVNYTIKINRDFIPRFKIEEYTNKIVVKNIDDNYAQIELYISVYPKQFNLTHRAFINEMNKINNEYCYKSDILKFDNITFITEKAYGAEDGELYSYDFKEYKSSHIFDGHFILKYIVKIKNNGENIKQKFCDKKE